MGKENGISEEELRRLSELEGAMDGRITHFERRMDLRMEKPERLLISSMSNNKDCKSDLPENSGQVELCESDDDDDNLFSSNPKHKMRRKKATPFSQENQIKEGENVSTLNTLMGIRLVRQLVEGGG